MQSTARDVSSYLDEVPAARKERLTALRELCLQRLQGYEECMDYGMPGYKKDGVVEVAFASQKNYISLYILKEAVVEANRELLAEAGLPAGKSCIRYTKPEKIDLAVVDTLLQSTVNTPGQSA